MASKFFAGMTNVVEVLNQMWDAFAAGPYNAVPLTGGTMSGALSAPVVIATAGLPARPRSVLGNTTEGEPNIALTRWSGSGTNDVTWRMVNKNGLLQFDLSTNGAFGTQSFYSAMSLDISGRLLVGTTSAVCHTIQNGNQSQGQINLSLTNCSTFFVSSGAYGNAAATSLAMNFNTTTGRSINCGGTINAGGADYAEYMVKAAGCADVRPGQIIGIDASGKLTDVWDRAVSFVVKSTNPCMVGGDVWSQHLGPRPVEPARADSGDEAARDTQMHAFRQAEQAFEAALEAARQTVDRIAFAGQVPVNVRGAMPGQYILPVPDGGGIAGVAVDADDMTLKQSMQAVGKVIAIESDGRARIVVKVV